MASKKSSDEIEGLIMEFEINSPDYLRNKHMLTFMGKNSKSLDNDEIIMNKLETGNFEQKSEITKNQDDTKILKRQSLNFPNTFKPRFAECPMLDISEKSIEDHTELTSKEDLIMESKEIGDSKKEILPKLDLNLIDNNDTVISYDVARPETPDWGSFTFGQGNDWYNNPLCITPSSSKSTKKNSVFDKKFSILDRLKILKLEKKNSLKKTLIKENPKLALSTAHFWILFFTISIMNGIGILFANWFKMMTLIYYTENQATNFLYFLAPIMIFFEFFYGFVVDSFKLKYTVFSYYLSLYSAISINYYFKNY